ncbi:MAG: MFS transporter, partial [Bacteroidales bacterium]|nr:MFS transporter [Bacteroidales bacterium]
MNKRSNFPPVFWVANSVEVLERFAYYGIFFTFYAYMNDMGFDRAELGNVQKWFLFISYFIPVFSGTFADKFGFKKILIVSYLAYLPSILLLMVTDTLSGIKLTMISIGFAAGIFKPLVSGTIRLTTDSTNKTLGFGIFYAMVNIGGSFGPIIAAKLRAISWNTAFMAAAISIGLMLIITILFYKEPEREKSDVNIGKKLYGILETLMDVRFSVFLVLLGFFFWLPFWAFFNICPAYIDTHIDTVKLYNSFSEIFGEWLTRFLSREEDGIWRINGESIAHTGWIIMILQV